MLILFLVLFANAQASTCANYVATSEIQNKIDLVPGAGSKKCDANDPCVCADGIHWPAAKFSNGVLTEDQNKLDEISSAASRREAMKTLRKGILDKNLKDLTRCEKKLVVGLECTNPELGL